MKCGLDVGSTLIKAICVDEITGSRHFFSNRNMSKADLINALRQLQVTQVSLTGIGNYDLPFEVIHDSGSGMDSLQHEVNTQAKGALKLMEWEGMPSENFGLISIGTGVSYAHCQGERVVQQAFGNFLGGGFILGMSSQLMLEEKDPLVRLKSLDDLANSVLHNKNLSDILLKDQLPVLSSRPEGEFLISSCGKISDRSDLQDVCFGLVNCVAASLIRDILIFKTAGIFKVSDLVIVGTTISELSSLQSLITRHATTLGMEVYIPVFAAYAGAVGALSYSLEMK